MPDVCHRLRNNFDGLLLVFIIVCKEAKTDLSSHIMMVQVFNLKIPISCSLVTVSVMNISIDSPFFFGITHPRDMD